MLCRVSRTAATHNQPASSAGCGTDADTSIKKIKQYHRTEGYFNEDEAHATAPATPGTDAAPDGRNVTEFSVAFCYSKRLFNDFVLEAVRRNVATYHSSSMSSSPSFCFAFSVKFTIAVANALNIQLIQLVKRKLVDILDFIKQTRQSLPGHIHHDLQMVYS